MTGSPTGGKTATCATYDLTGDWGTGLRYAGIWFGAAWILLIVWLTQYGRTWPKCVLLLEKWWISGLEMDDSRNTVDMTSI